MDIEKKIAEEIMMTLRKFRLPLTLDVLTEGKGNCFPLAILAQCRRHDIYCNLESHIQDIIMKNNPTLLRSAVKKFILSSNHKTIKEFKQQFENVVTAVDGIQWIQYWEKMSTNYEWVDYTFIQSTAWFLNHDILIITTSSRQQDPYMRIQGNPSGENASSCFPPLIMGCKSNSHYQSLLPSHGCAVNFGIETQFRRKNCSNQMEETQIKTYADVAQMCPQPLRGMGEVMPDDKNGLQANLINIQNSKEPNVKNVGDQKSPTNTLNTNVNRTNTGSKTKVFNYKYKSEHLNFQIMPDKSIICPICSKKFKNVIHHLDKSKCKVTSLGDFSDKLKQFRLKHFHEDIKREECERKRITRAKQRERDIENVRNDNAKQKARYRDNLRANDNEKVKREQRIWKEKSRKTQKMNDHQKLKNDNIRYKERSMLKKRVADIKKVQMDQNQRKARYDLKQRNINETKFKEHQNQLKSKSDARKREKNEIKVKENQNQRKAKSEARKREINETKFKEDQNQRKAKSEARKREIDEEKVREEQNKRKRLSRNKKKEADPRTLAAVEIDAQRNKKKNWGEKDRLREFREATKYNAIFICNSCHRRLFQENVEIMSNKLISDLNVAKEGLLKKCMQERIVTPVDGKQDCYLCKTCIGHIKSKRMPPMSVNNKLILNPQDDDMKLTEMEGTLIAKDIIFQKIYQLPKSRWTALTDRIVNVPINDKDIKNTVELLPRTPRKAQLVGVSLKRKLEYKNTHISQLVNPDKIVNMIKALKENGNPYYQFNIDIDNFEARCKSEDPEGFGMIFPNGIDEDLDSYQNQSSPIIDNENPTDGSSIINSYPTDNQENEELKQELEYLANDPVRKYQFRYDDSLCLANKYPEAEAVDITKGIAVAPGEGKVPTDIMMEKDWDLRAFPHLHNLDGSNGKDEERNTHLTDQSYFIQRILNQDQRFARCSTYKYAAVAYLEKKQLRRNINIAGTRGKKVNHGDGNITYDLEDGYAVLDDIKSTPRYWKKVKQEMIAKLENLGAFQLFFTLSCADLRWDENFAAILRDMGLNLIFSVIPDDTGYAYTKIEVEYIKEGKKTRKDLKEYIDEEIKTSLHELIRGNVLLATRFFNQRVKKFFTTIVMGKNNTMNVQYYTYKVEFQERGAGHIHGTLWLNLEKLEDLVRSDDGPLIENKEHKFEGLHGENLHPLKGLKRAFKKLKDNEKINGEEKEALKNFVDEFTTVSTNKNVVGETVSKIVLEVNKHSHTKSCQKHESQCRFLFPRYPSTKTIIAVPLEGVPIEEKHKRLKNYKAILKKVGAVLNDEEKINQIVAKFGSSENETLDEYEENKKQRIKELLEMADVTIEEYENALSYTNGGYKVVHERDVTEIYINTYNKEWIRAWNGNMDMSPCLDYHAVITYISDYFAKDDTGLMDVIKTAVKEDNSESTKDRMKLVANTFMTHRQIGEAEAVYRLLPNMVMKHSNVTCQWISIGRRSEQSKRWRLATEAEIENGTGLTKIKDREGLWIEQNDILSKYLRRPEELELISAAQFCKMYTTSGITTKSDKADEDMEDEKDFDDVNENLLPVLMTEFIITDTNDRIKLPKIINIRDPLPREKRIMKKRRLPAVLRYHKSNKDNQFEVWMLKELMLYTHFREDDLEDYENNTAVNYEKKEKWIRSVKSVVMEHLENVEEARYMVEQSNKKVDMDVIGAELNPTYEQDQVECLEEGQSQHPDYLHLDTDGIQNLENNNHPNSIFKPIKIPTIGELRKQTQKLDEYQKEILNIAVKYAKDIVKSRRDGNIAPLPIYIIGHGGAGAGKSTVIHLVSKWCHTILAKSGDDIECPYVIKTAFTGTAASNIEGQTLHTSFGFNFDNKHYSLSDKKRDEKRLLFKNLKILIIDEISMVKADMLYQLDLKLQELKERIGVPFGGVAILLFGDMMQLRPVLGAFAFEKPKNPDYHATFALENRWEMFQVINLEINHRQGGDKDYADILNRIRIGEMSEDDINMLRTRIRPKDHPDLKEANIFIVPTRKVCADFNNDYLNTINGDEIILTAIHYHATQKKFKPFIEKKEGAIGTTSFLDEIKVKIGSKIILIHNIDTSDGLTNGQLGTILSIIGTTEGKPDKLVIQLKNPEAGIANRRRFPNIARKFPTGTIIERVSINYSIRKKGGIVGATATLVQFPIKLAHAITSHKTQGHTIYKPLTAAYDLLNIFEEAQGYVMLSRTEELKQVYIIDDFNEHKIYPSSKALRELERMNKVSINQNPSPWSKNMDNSIKILSLNCAGLKAHYDDIKNDKKIMKADIIHLNETSLDEEDDEKDFPLNEYTVSGIKAGAGKGIVTYFNSQKFKIDKKIKAVKYQALKFVHKDVDIISIYRSQLAHPVALLEDLQKVINSGKLTLIVGDVNICFRENYRNQFIQGLIKFGFKQMINEPTHIYGRIIDHAYILDPNKNTDLIIERYSPYYSDHDGLCIIIPKKKDTT